MLYYPCCVDNIAHEVQFTSFHTGGTKMKKSLFQIFVGLITAAAAVGGEVASLNAPADFTVPSRVSDQDGVLFFKGNNISLVSKKIITINPAKKYRISGEFKAAKGAPAAGIIMGFVPFDKNGVRIRTAEYNTVADTMTETAAAAKAGSKTIVLKDASKWDNKVPYNVIAFNVADDFSDLPNRNIIGIVPGGVKMRDGVWEVTLSAPLKKDVPAGTKVRQQRGGDSYINRLHKRLNDQWSPAFGIVAGFAGKTHSSLKFWPGTEKVRIVITFVRGSKESVTEFRNIKVEELD